jgi:hypothetical protein
MFQVALCNKMLSYCRTDRRFEGTPVPSICREWDGGVTSFRIILGNLPDCTVSAPEDQNVTLHISVCFRCAYSNLSCCFVFYNVITPAEAHSWPVTSACGIIQPYCWFVSLYVTCITRV